MALTIAVTLDASQVEAGAKRIAGILGQTFGPLQQQMQQMLQAVGTTSQVMAASLEAVTLSVTQSLNQVTESLQRVSQVQGTLQQTVTQTSTTMTQAAAANTSYAQSLQAVTTSLGPGQFSALKALAEQTKLSTGSLQDIRNGFMQTGQAAVGFGRNVQDMGGMVAKAASEIQGNLGQRMRTGLEDLSKQTIQTTGATQDLRNGFIQTGKVALEAKDDFEKWHESLKQGSSLFGQAIKDVVAYGASYIGLRTIIQGVKSLFETGIGIEAIQLQFAAATGSVEKGAQAFNFAADLARKLGTGLESTTKSFGLLNAATRGTVVQGRDTREVFAAVATAARVLQLSNDQTQRTFLALQEMAGKGVIAMEELRRQFGQALPGALQAVARALPEAEGSLSRLFGLVESGTLTASKFFPALAKGLQEYNEKAPAALESTRTAIGRLGTAWEDLGKTVAEQGGSAIVAAGAEVATRDLLALRDVVNTVGDALRRMFGAPVDQARTLGQAVDNMTAALQVLQRQVDSLTKQLPAEGAQPSLLDRIITMIYGGKNTQQRLAQAQEDMRQVMQARAKLLEEARRLREGPAEVTDENLKAVETAGAAITALDRQGLGLGFTKTLGAITATSTALDILAGKMGALTRMKFLEQVFPERKDLEGLEAGAQILQRQLDNAKKIVEIKHQEPFAEHDIELANQRLLAQAETRASLVQSGNQKILAGYQAEAQAMEQGLIRERERALSTAVNTEARAQVMAEFQKKSVALESSITAHVIDLKRKEVREDLTAQDEILKVRIKNAQELAQRQGPIEAEKTLNAIIELEGKRTALKSSAAAKERDLDKELAANKTKYIQGITDVERSENQKKLALAQQLQKDLLTEQIRQAEAQKNIFESQAKDPTLSQEARDAAIANMKAKNAEINTLTQQQLAEESALKITAAKGDTELIAKIQEQAKAKETAVTLKQAKDLQDIAEAAAKKKLALEQDVAKDIMTERLRAAEAQKDLLESAARDPSLSKAERDAAIESVKVQNAIILELTKESVKQQTTVKILAAQEDEKLIAQIRALGLAQVETVREKQVRDLQELYKGEAREYADLLKSNQKEISNFVSSSLDILVDHTKSFTDFFRSTLNVLKKWFFDFIGDLAGYALTRPITVLITGVVGTTGKSLAEQVANMITGGSGASTGEGQGTAGATVGLLGGLGRMLGMGTGGSGEGLLANLFGETSPLGTAFSWFSTGLSKITGYMDIFSQRLGTMFGMNTEPWFGTTPTSGIQTLGGAISGITGLVKAITARDTAGRVIGGVGSALGFAGMIPGPQQPFLLAASAIVQLLGPMVAKMFGQAGPRFAMGGLGGVGIRRGAGGLEVTGELTSQIGRAERLPEGVDTGAIQEALQKRTMAMIRAMVEGINKVAIRPEDLLGGTQDALNRALAQSLTLNSSSAKNFQKDLEEQTHFVAVQISSFFLKPLHDAFRQLETAELKDQIARLPGATEGMVQVFKGMNAQLEELSKVANTDVLRQLSSVRSRVEIFGTQLADSTHVIAISIVDQITKALTTQAENLLDQPLAKQITDFTDVMDQSFQALTALKAAQSSLTSVGLNAGGVTDQIARLTGIMVKTAGDVSTQIVTGALADLSTSLDQVLIQPLSVQATTVDSLFSTSLSAIQALWTEWHKLEDAGLDASKIQAQFEKLLGGMLTSASMLLRNTLVKGTFPEFLDVLLSIPDALAKMNPVFERLKALGQAFAQVVGPIQQAIAQGEEQLRTPTERMGRTAEQIHDFELAITAAGTSAEKALPLYAQLAQAIQANAAAQIAAVQQVGAVIEQITSMLDARLDTSQRLAKINQQIIEAPGGGQGSMENISRLVTLYGQQLELLAQLRDAIKSGLEGIDETLRADESLFVRATRLTQTAMQPQPNRSPEALLTQASALQDAISAVRELIDVIKQGLQNIQDILHATETTWQRVSRLVSAVTPAPGAAPTTDPEALIRLAGAIGDAIGAVRELISTIEQGLQGIRQTLHANETVSARAFRLVAELRTPPGDARDPAVLLNVAGQVTEALTAVRALIDMLQQGIESIDTTLFSLLSVAEQVADLQAKIAEVNQDIAKAGTSTPEQLIKLVGLTQQGLSLQRQITQALESTLEDLRSSFENTPSPAVQISETRAQITALQALANTGTATPEQLQQLVDLNQRLLGLGQQFDLLDVQQEALDALKALEPVIKAQIEASKARETEMIDNLKAMRKALEDQLAGAKTLEEQLTSFLETIQQQLEASLVQAKLTEQQLVAQLVNVQLQLLNVLAATQSVEAQLVDQLVNVRALLQAQLTMIEGAEALTIRYLDAQLNALYTQLQAQYGTANVDLIIKQIQEWSLTELKTLNQRLRDLFLSQPDAQALFGTEPILNHQTSIMNRQELALNSLVAQTNTVIDKLDVVDASLNRPIRTTPAMQGGFIALQMGGLLDKASMNRSETGPLHFARGGMVNAMLEPGELIFPSPFTSSQIQALTTMNAEFSRFGRQVWAVPGQGSGDQVPARLRSGSFVMNRHASRVLGYQDGGVATSYASNMDRLLRVTVSLGPVVNELITIEGILTQQLQTFRQIQAATVGTLDQWLMWVNQAQMQVLAPPEDAALFGIHDEVRNHTKLLQMPATRMTSGGWMMPGAREGDHGPTLFPVDMHARTSRMPVYQDEGFASEPSSKRTSPAPTNYITINIQVIQRPGQSGRELVEEIRRQLRREFRSPNDRGPWT